MDDFSQDYETTAPVEQPAKRQGWPKGKKRGPRKAKDAAATNGAVARKPRLDPVAAAARGVLNPAKPKTLTELTFKVNRATAEILEKVVELIQSIPEEECRRDLIAALQRVFDEH